MFAAVILPLILVPGKSFLILALALFLQGEQQAYDSVINFLAGFDLYRGSPLTCVYVSIATMKLLLTNT